MFPISREAEADSKRVMAEIGEIKKTDPVQLRGIQRPLWMKLTFSDTAACQQIMKETCAKIQETMPWEERLIGHGADRGGGASHFFQILRDGKLKHYSHHENYGSLAAGHDIQIGGHWDSGWGLFVAKVKDIREERLGSDNGVTWEMPLNKLQAIILPAQIVTIIRREFGSYQNLLKSYVEFSDELKRLHSLNE